LCHELPTLDSVLAQLLWLRADEDGLLRIANRRRMTRRKEHG
jgi:hypothetical protein